MRNEQRRPEIIYIEDEGFVPIRAADRDRAFRFCRMFEPPDPSHPQHENDALIALGTGMKDSEPSGREKSIPAGYVYLGQFVNHDITFDWTRNIPPDQPAPESEKIAQGRSPTLSLDSIYGGDSKCRPDLYEDDPDFYQYNRIRLRLGKTTPRKRFKVEKKFDNDLPRRPVKDLKAPKQAIIGNPLNDENLILAQTHVAFLKFHNKVVDLLKNKKGMQPEGLFKAARKMVVQHYHSIVLHDFMPKVIDEKVYNDVVQNNHRRLLYPRGIPQGKRPALPVEFVLAAFRFGHSMVRNTYEWNDVFNSEARANYGPKLNVLFRLAKLSDSLLDFDTLPSDWIIDWRRFYNFGKRGGSHCQLNLASLIDTNLAYTFQRLPEFAHIPEKHMRSLAVRDLLVGQAVRLPAGQDVAEAMRAKGISVVELLPNQIASARGQQTRGVQRREFDRQTPLWYYILHEAKVQKEGKKLGQVGSYIVAETLHAVIEASDDSILREDDWKPECDLKPQDSSKFTMVDLLTFVNDIDPVGDYLKDLTRGQ